MKKKATGWQYKEVGRHLGGWEAQCLVSLAAISINDVLTLLRGSLETILSAPA